MVKLRRFVLGEDASSAVEYAVLLSLILVVCLIAVTALGEATYEAMWAAAEALE